MTLPVVDWHGLVYRAHNPKWGISPTSGYGAKRYGGRFNKVGREALYTSLSFETAYVEAQQAFLYKPQPLMILAYNVECQDILDLSNGAICADLGLKFSDLDCPWEADLLAGRTPKSWMLAETFIKGGVAGIIVPSFARGAQPSGRNLVLWDWDDKPPHKITVIDDEDRL